MNRSLPNAVSAAPATISRRVLACVLWGALFFSLASCMGTDGWYEWDVSPTSMHLKIANAGDEPSADTAGVSESEPSGKKADQESEETQSTIHYTATIAPAGWNEEAEGYTGLELTVKSLADVPLDIVWEETIYLRNGKQTGYFLHEENGSDQIMPGESLKLLLVPESLKGDILPQGENGLVLTLREGVEETRARGQLSFTRVWVEEVK